MHPMKHPILRSLALLALVLSAASCSLTQLKAPTLSLGDVQLVGGDLFQQRLLVRVHVANPNDRALPIKALEYTVEVEGQTFATGSSAAPFVVPPLGETDFDMNVNTNLASTFMKLATRGGGGGDIGYRLVGKVSLSEGFLRSIPFDQRGTFKLH